MGSVWVCYFPTCTILPCRNCIFSPTHLLHHSTTLSLRARASQSTTSARTRTRRSRRIKTDAEICNDIREFLASVGLPDDHIPSTKELLLHGWNDLANIVRRRGHKQIQELLTSSLLKADADFLSAETSLNERLDAANDFEDPLTGQNEKVDSLVDNVETSSEYFLGSSLYVDSSSSSGEGIDIVEEALANLTIEDGLREVKDHAEVVSNATKENFYPTEGTIVDDDSDSLYPKFSSQSSIMPAEISGELPFETVSSGNSESEDSLVGKTVGQSTLWTENHSGTSFNDSDLGAEEKEFDDLEQKDFGASEGQDDDNDDIVENVTTISEVSVRENLSGDGRLDSIVHSADSSATNLDTLANISLKEKVAKFIQNGDLDPVEDHVAGISVGDDTQESKDNIKSELDEYIPPPGSSPPQDNNVMAHGNSLTSKLDPSGPLDFDKPLWDDDLPHEDLSTHFDQDADTKTPKLQNETEINHLKFMLSQKELELARLKEQIEKEKLALSVLQTKAEEEISKARKLISEKDVELHFAEESLSGLKEDVPEASTLRAVGQGLLDKESITENVQIEFCGDGDIVEVAGSFNGWHHRIKLDPQPSTSAIDLGGSRSSRFWSTILWLYPGVYEIKFVVDGKWMTDPQRESVTRGHICNNILRVDR